MLPLAVERPPSRLYLLATTPSGRTYRWGEDENDADQVFADLQDSDSVPGGYKELSCALPRRPHVDYGDMEMGTHIELFGAGGYKVWEGRLERAPKSSGDHITMDPAAYGYQGHLADDESAQGVPIDREIGALSAISAARRIVLGATWDTSAASPQVAPDVSTAIPAANMTKPGKISKADFSCTYYANGVRLGRVRFKITRVNLGRSAEDPNVAAFFYTDDNDVFNVSPTIIKENLTVAPEEFDLTIAVPEQFLLWALVYQSVAPAGVEGTEYGFRISELAVFDNSGIPVQGTWPELGVLASDVIAAAISKYAPLLTYSTGVKGTIRPTSFVIPHLTFKDPGPISEWVNQSNRFELNEWGVWDDKTFYLNPRGEREGRKRWVARVGDAHLQETGQQMERVWNGVIVQFQDVDGTTKYVGPSGSGYQLESAALVDPDPNNAANLIKGLRRWVKIAANGVSTAAGAVRIGELFLEQTRQLDGSGSASLAGYVEDEFGTLWPYYCVHSGDLIRFPDSSAPGWRYIVSAQRNRADRTVQVDLEAPPDSLAALLERLDVSIFSLAI